MLPLPVAAAAVVFAVREGFCHGLQVFPTGDTCAHHESWEFTIRTPKLEDVMATEAYGMDFWVGKILRSKDKRELGRHIVITDLGGSRAECHTLIVGEPGKMINRGSRISLKSLATRWEHCRDAECYCKQRKDGEE